MRRKQDKILWGRLLRRGGALFLATLSVWALFLGAGGGAADAFRTLGENPAFVAGALHAELGGALPADDPLAGLNGWQRLVLHESAYLRTAPTAPASAPTATPPAAAPTPTPPLPAGQPAADHDDLAELPQPAAPAGEVVARTLIPTSTDGYAFADGIYLYNRTKLPVDLPALAAAPVEISLPADAPQVLIVHTHATEAYTQDGTDRYPPSDNNNRTLDEHYNVVRVGDEIARVFGEMGLTVLHDRTAYDYPAYAGAYGRSGAAVAQYLAQNPSIRIVLDIHRDALLGQDGTVYKAVTTIDGTSTAQVMLVLGSSEGGAHPNWTQNLTLATKLQRSMNTLYPTLARPMALRSSVYNQALTTGSLLVEVGTHGNTLQEALAGARLFARATGQVLLGLRAPG